MYNEKTFDRATYQTRGIFNTYVYRTDDPASEVLSAGYFDACRFFNEAGWLNGVIHVYSSTGAFSVRIGDGELTLIESNGSGWAQYNDDQYTSGSPFTVTSGTTAALPNNAASSITSQLPVDAVTFYDGVKFTAATSGDAYTWSVRFKAKPGTNNASVFCDIDIGGSQGVILSDSRRLPRGTGQENPINFTFSGYTLDTFIANGGEVQISAVDGNLEIYDISYVITRTNKAK